MRITFLLAIAALTASSYASAAPKHRGGARGDPVAVTYDAFALAAGAVALPKTVAAGDGVWHGTAAAVGGDVADCAVGVSGGALRASADAGGVKGCADLWTAIEPRTLDVDLWDESENVELYLRLTPRAATATGALSASGNALAVQGSIDVGASIAIHSSIAGDAKWETKKVGGASVDLTPAQMDAASKNALVVFSRTTGDDVKAWRVKSSSSSSSAASSSAAASSAAASAKAPDAALPFVPASVFVPSGTIPEADATCPPSATTRYAFHVICIDAVAGQPSLIDPQPSTLVVKPNKPFLVMVKHRADKAVAVTLTGTRGLFKPVVRTDNDAGARGDNTAPTMWTIRTFSPRTPGAVDVGVTLTDGKTGTTIAAQPFELLVETTYAGALRVGIGLVTLGAVDATFDVRARASSGAGAPSGEIVSTSAGVADTEVVLAYAPYLDDGGRGELGCASKPLCLSPFVGVGVVAPKNGGVDVLKSVHAGFEWEPAPSVSIALTLVGRRVDRLAPGAFVGGPAVPGQVPLQQTIGFGAGIVFSVTPGFLRLATGESSSSLGGVAKALGGGT